MRASSLRPRALLTRSWLSRIDIENVEPNCRDGLQLQRAAHTKPHPGNRTDNDIVCYTYNNREGGDMRDQTLFLKEHRFYIHRFGQVLCCTYRLGGFNYSTVKATPTALQRAESLGHPSWD